MATSQTEQARLSTLTCVEYAKELNAATQVWLEAHPGAWAGTLTEDAAHWAEYGYTNGLEMAFGNARSTYSDVYKDVHGIRPRGTRFETLEQVEAALEPLLDEWED